MRCARRWCAPPGGARLRRIRRWPASSRMPRKYVKSYATGPRGESQVIFDGAARRTGRQRRRPQRLGARAALHARGARSAASRGSRRCGARGARAVAAERGLPISLIPMALTDSAGNPLGPDALLQAAQRYGADEVLVGRGRRRRRRPTLQWTLYTARSECRAGAARLALASTTPWTCWCRSRATSLAAGGGRGARADRWGATLD